jgi:hypothetical protein
MELRSTTVCEGSDVNNPIIFAGKPFCLYASPFEAKAEP